MQTVGLLKAKSQICGLNMLKHHYNTSIFHLKPWLQNDTSKAPS